MIKLYEEYNNKWCGYNIIEKQQSFKFDSISKLNDDYNLQGEACYIIMEHPKNKHKICFLLIKSDWYNKDGEYYSESGIHLYLYDYVSNLNIKNNIEKILIENLTEREFQIAVTPQEHDNVHNSGILIAKPLGDNTKYEILYNMKNEFSLKSIENILKEFEKNASDFLKGKIIINGGIKGFTIKYVKKILKYPNYFLSNIINYCYPINNDTYNMLYDLYPDLMKDIGGIDKEEDNPFGVF